MEVGCHCEGQNVWYTVVSGDTVQRPWYHTRSLEAQKPNIFLSGALIACLDTTDCTG